MPGGRPSAKVLTAPLTDLPINRSSAFTYMYPACTQLACSFSASWHALSLPIMLEWDTHALVLQLFMHIAWTCTLRKLRMQGKSIAWLHSRLVPKESTCAIEAMCAVDNCPWGPVFPLTKQVKITYAPAELIDSSWRWCLPTPFTSNLHDHTPELCQASELATSSRYVYIRLLHLSVKDVRAKL